jgi:hypothetical protein
MFVTCCIKIKQNGYFCWAFRPVYLCNIKKNKIILIMVFYVDDFNNEMAEWNKCKLSDKISDVWNY